MQEFIKSIKFKIVLIFILPTVGVIFFSSYYTFQKVKEYQNTKYLADTIKFTRITTFLVKSLQKERGISISLTEKRSKYFLKKLAIQRVESDKIFNNFEKILSSYKRVGSDVIVKAIIEQYGDVKDFRKKIDKHRVNIFVILKFYSRLIENLIDSLNTLNVRFVNKIFFIKMKNYQDLMSIAEINGKERALISFSLQEKCISDKIKSELQKLESRSKYLKNIFLEEANIDTLLILRNYIPKSYDKKFTKIKQDIIFNNNLSFISPSKWWEVATNYIDNIYKVNFIILKNLLQLKDTLKKEAYKSLGLSFLFFLAMLSAAYLFERIISKLLSEISTLIDSVDKQKRIYQTLAQFSEIVLYEKDKRAMLNSLNTILFKSEEFSYSWIGTLKNGSIKPLITENITSTIIQQDLIQNDSLGKTKFFRDIDKSIKEKHYVLSLNENFSCELCKDIEIFGIFPIIISGKVKYLLVVAAKNSEKFDAKIIDMILKCLDILSFAFEKINIQEKEKILQQELKITSKAFDAHEAITISDAQGNIIKVNKAFTKITGYKPEEVIGNNPRILKSGKHGKEFYEKMWKDLTSKGYWHDEIYNKRKNGEIYPEILSISAIRDDKGVITNFIAHFFDISNIKEVQKSLEDKIKYDQLTHILNRQSMFEKLKEIFYQNQRVGEYSGFLFMDLDNFKFINDYYGHDVGDKILIKVTKILKDIAKEGDIVARIGGDEFAFISNRLGSDKDIAIKKSSILAEKIVDIFSNPINIDDNYNINITFSIGIKLFPDSEKDYKEVMIDADIAMYNAKKEGKRQFSFFNSRLELESKRFLVLKNEFEEGLKEGQIVVQYQPKIYTKDNTIAGFEALAAWNHPTKGLIFADDFLYVTQNNKLSIDFHKYILKKVCTQVKQWQDKYSNFDLKISLNISGELFYNKHFVDNTMDIITKSGVDPRSLDFEILEDIFLKNKEQVIAIINEFKSKGITFSLDDFGTGFSSISSLHLLPIDNLKIDKTFILHLFEGKNKEIVKLSIDIAKVYGIDVVAEGVEDKESLDFIKEQGCKYYQGYYFSKSLPTNEAEDLFSKKYL